VSDSRIDDAVAGVDDAGYAVIRNVLEPEIRGDLHERAQWLLASAITRGRDRGADGKDGFRGCIALDRAFMGPAADPLVLRTMLRLLGPNIHLLSSHLIAMPSPPKEHRSIRVPDRPGWHRDMYGVSRDLGLAATPRLAVKCAYYLTEPSVQTGLTMVLPGSHQLQVRPAIGAGAIDPAGAITPDIGRHDALLFENRTWHAGGLNMSGEPRIALIYQYGYRWLAQVDDPVDIWPEATAIERQLLGAPDRADDGSLAKGAGASALAAFAHEHKLPAEEDS
jgi:hypothetical protein